MTSEASGSASQRATWTSSLQNPRTIAQQHTATEAAEAWAVSAQAFISFEDAGDRSRTVLLDPVMLDACGDVRGRRVLDIGCGEGRFCRMLGERGARCAGIDPTPGMTEAAMARDVTRGSYARAIAEKLPFAAASFDLAVSYITLVDVPDFRSAIAEAARVLKPGGRLVVANIGFVSASYGWLRDDDGNRLYHRIDRYAEEWSQVFEWSGMRIVNWHRPLSAYMQAYLAAGLVLLDFQEPVPEDQSLRDDPWFEGWFRVPNFNTMVWEKPRA